MKPKRSIFTLQPKQIEFLAERSQLTGASEAEIVRRALDFYQQHLEKSDAVRPDPATTTPRVRTGVGNTD